MGRIRSLIQFPTGDSSSTTATSIVVADLDSLAASVDSNSGTGISVGDDRFLRGQGFTESLDDSGPFDVIGDIHGCRAELESLLISLGYDIRLDTDGRAIGATHPANRKAVFLGDLADRGPDTPGVFRLAMAMVASGSALCVLGNHDDKLFRSLSGRAVKIEYGLSRSLSQLEHESLGFREQLKSFIRALPPYRILDSGRLVVSHAGLPERFHGEESDRVRRFCLYGDPSGGIDQFGLPTRRDWAADYRGEAMVLYGHTPAVAGEWVNNTMCLDTGCVFGGRLTALRYPERELVSVPAARVYCVAARPFPANPEALSASDFDS